MSLKLFIDAEQIAKQLKEWKYEVEQDIHKSVANLSAMTHAKVSELASTELHSSKQELNDNLGFEEIAPNVWVVSINEKALWIEEGIENNKDMKPDLLKNAKKTSKKGYKYRSIPFHHSKASSQLTPKAQLLVAQLKSELKKANIPFKKIEKTAEGSPRLGKLHTLNISSEKPTQRASTPALMGVNIYQTLTKTGNVRRDILTFRTVSESPASNGKWIHPGFQGKHFLERALDWAEKEFFNNILPEILNKYK